MPNAGFPDVRRSVAKSLATLTGLPFAEGCVVMTAGAAGAQETDKTMRYFGADRFLRRERESWE